MKKGKEKKKERKKTHFLHPPFNLLLPTLTSLQPPQTCQAQSWQFYIRSSDGRSPFSSHTHVCSNYVGLLDISWEMPSPFSPGILSCAFLTIKYPSSFPHSQTWGSVHAPVLGELLWTPPSHPALSTSHSLFIAFFTQQFTIMDLIRMCELHVGRNHSQLECYSERCSTTSSLHIICKLLSNERSWPRPLIGNF